MDFLTKGSQVEVSSDEEGLTGAWFVATVIQPPPFVSTPTSAKKNKPPTQSRNNLVYVEYHNLLSDDGSNRRLREYANVSYVRPSPPSDNSNSDSDINFQLYDLVDAFYRDAWWTGIVTEVVDTSNFVVNFQNPPDQIQFNISDLRVHREWDSGKWVQPQKQRTAGLMFTVGKKVEVCFDKEDLRDGWFPATVVTNNGNNSFVVEYQQPGVGDEATVHKVTVDYQHIRPSPPHLRDKNFVLLEKVDAYFDFGWWNGVITKELPDNRYNVFFKHTKKEREFIYSSVRPHMEWKGGKWFNTSQGDVNKQTTPGVDSVATSIINKTKQTTVTVDNNSPLPSKRMEDDILSKTTLTNDQSTEGFDSEASVINDQAFGKTENLSHGKKVRGKRGKSTTNSSKKKGRLTSEVDSLKALGEGNSIEEEEHVDVTTKELGLPVVEENGLQTPQEKKSSSPEPPALVNNKEEGNAESVAPKRKRGRPPKLQTVDPKTPVSVEHEEGGEVVKVLEENAAMTITTRKPKKNKTKRGKRRTISINTDTPAQDCEVASKGKDSANQPLSSGGEGGNLKKSIDIEVFVRSSPLWKTIESLEAFRKIPQKPHFRPLLEEGVKESAREGLAIGNMATFASVVDKTCSLRFDHGRNEIEDCLETLADLETHGFQVEVIRERLTGLLLVKDKQQEMVEKRKGVEKKIEKHKLEENKLNQEIDDMDKQIKELEERRRELLLEKERKELKIGGMKAAMEQEMTQVGTEFDDLAASPLPFSSLLL